MAEIVVNLVMDEVVSMIEEGNLLSGVREDIVSIRDELEFVRPFLRDADASAERGEIEDMVKIWMRQLMKVSLKLEDDIDKYKLHWARVQSQRRRGLLRCFDRFLVLNNMFQSTRELALEIHDIRETIHDIQERGYRYGLKVTEEPSRSNSWEEPSNSNSWEEPSSSNSSEEQSVLLSSSLFMEEDDFVGFKYPQDVLRKWLAGKDSGHRTVVSVVGTGGVGKTALVHKVYREEIASGKFSHHAWIGVSQSYNIEEILRSLISQVSDPNEIATMNEESMTEDTCRLKRYLQERRYMVVLDDVWSTDLWKSIKSVLPENNMSSCVIITTRKQDVAAPSEISESSDHVLKLGPLTDDEAMKLFSKKVFHSPHKSGSSTSTSYPPRLIELSRKIVEKCNGLPLAVAAIGGLLSTKDKSVFEWQRFYDSLSSEFRSKIHLQNVNKIMSLSYLDLPYLLKPCFLYFAILPEGYSISHGRLVRSWIAEGFIKEIMGITTLEEIAEYYLRELIHRNLVQVSRVNSIGKDKKYGVHRVMREVILSRTPDMGFCQLLSKDDDSYFHREARRLSVQSRGEIVLESITQPGVRSVFTFGEDAFPDSFDVGKIIANLKLVKVLDFEDAPIDSIPEEVGNLLLLKYLNLRNTKVKTLPKSIGRLQNLLILDVKNSFISELPSVINRLRKLRHLLASVKPLENIDDQQQGLKIQEGFGCLEALQTLYFVDASHGQIPFRGPFRDLEKLRQLRKLGIKMLKTKDGMSLCTAIQNMSHLETLDVSTASKKDILDLKHITWPPQSLQKLYLKGCLERFPSWISKLQKLVRIKLRSSKLKDDPLEPLQKLPMLLELELTDAYDGDILNFEAGAFPKLIVLKLEGLRALRYVEKETGALPRLGAVHIHMPSCPQLNPELLPKEIESLRRASRFSSFSSSNHSTGASISSMRMPCPDIVI